MKKTQTLLKSIFSVVFIAVLLPMAPCDAASNPSALVGRWCLVDGSTGDNPGDMELLSDGTGIAGNTGITWKTEKDRFYIINPLKASSLNYKVQGSTLTLTGDKGILKYQKFNINTGCPMSAKAIASEVTPTASTWTKLQRAYIVETGEIGNFAQIDYRLPGNGGVTTGFTYSGEFTNGVASWIAKNNANMGKCPAGNQWILLARKDGDNIKIEVRLPKDTNCQELTPEFSRLEQ